MTADRSANAVLTTTLAVCGWTWMPTWGQHVNCLIIQSVTDLLDRHSRLKSGRSAVHANRESALVSESLVLSVTHQAHRGKHVSNLMSLRSLEVSRLRYALQEVQVYEQGSDGAKPHGHKINAELSPVTDHVGEVFAKCLDSLRELRLAQVALNFGWRNAHRTQLPRRSETNTLQPC